MSFSKYRYKTNRELQSLFPQKVFLITLTIRVIYFIIKYQNIPIILDNLLQNILVESIRIEIKRIITFLEFCILRLIFKIVIFRFD